MKLMITKKKFVYEMLETIKLLIQEENWTVESVETSESKHSEFKNCRILASDGRSVTLSVFSPKNKTSGEG